MKKKQDNKICHTFVGDTNSINRFFIIIIVMVYVVSTIEPALCVAQNTLGEFLITLGIQDDQSVNHEKAPKSSQSD